MRLLSEEKEERAKEENLLDAVVARDLKLEMARIEERYGASYGVLADAAITRMYRDLKWFCEKAGLDSTVASAATTDLIVRMRRRARANARALAKRGQN